MNRSRILYGCTILSYKDLLECDQKNKMKLEYYKLINTNDEIKTSEKFTNYGVEIVKKEYIESKKLKIEKNELQNITNNENQVDEMLELFKINKVTPISLNDVIYDYMKK